LPKGSFLVAASKNGSRKGRCIVAVAAAAAAAAAAAVVFLSVRTHRLEVAACDGCACVIGRVKPRL
jgi:hypothetical protein